jgi:hypothetical protein
VAAVSRDANPAGPGGRRKKIQTNLPQGKTSHQKPKQGIIGRLFGKKKK